MRQWVLGELGTEEALLSALHALRAKGYARLDAHTPVPVEGLEEALGLKGSPLPAVALVAGLGGAVLGFVIQWFTNAVAWPLDVGDRPVNSAPTNIPITFETGVLVAALSIFGTLLALFRFPNVTHPVFQSDAFRSAS
ncbi:MAG: DUF3341 domain-containing protein, partial [Myxococcaceae bacterium]|nr:DUF3341 domain-containing protein [Myxococcaceae bacterium]